MDIGINLTGAEFGIGTESDTLGVNYFFPTFSQLEYYAAKGFSDIRLPILWERLQPELGGAFDADYFGRVKDVVAQAKELGLDVIVDLHNYGAYDGVLIGDAGVPVQAFAETWGQLAKEFADDANVVFGIMNEPLQRTAGDWLVAANAAIDAIRDAGATQEILVPGIHWTGGQSWTTSDNASVIGAKGAIVDPLNNFAFEIHQYLDDTSGTKDWVVSETIGVQRLTAVTEWAKANGAKLYLGEIGVADNPAAIKALANTLDYVSAHQDVWEGVAYLAGGTFTGSYGVEPKLGLLDVGQMNLLENYLGAAETRTALANGMTQVDTYVEGKSGPVITDVFDASGGLVSRSIFSADGELQREVRVAADGSYTAIKYDGTAAETVEYTADYDPSFKLLDDQTWLDDGSSIKKYYGEHWWNVVRQDTYDSHSKIQDITLYDDQGSIIVRFDQEKVSQFEQYDGNWSLDYRVSFDEDGDVATVLVEHADGTHTIQKFSGDDGAPVLTQYFGVSWDYQGQKTAPLNAHDPGAVAVVEARAFLKSHEALIAATVEESGAPPPAHQTPDPTPLPDTHTPPVDPPAVETPPEPVPTPDTTAPEVTIASLSGLTSQVIHGSAEADAIVHVFDGDSLLGETRASADGLWSLNVGFVAQGQHSLTAVATDVAGNIGTTAPVSVSDLIDDGHAKAILKGGAGGGILKGTAGKDIFLFDGHDGAGATTIQYFTSQDILVTSVKIRDNNNDGKITFGANAKLDLGGGGTVALSGDTGKAIKGIEFDGVHHDAATGHDFFVYSLIGSAAGLGWLDG